MSLNEVKALPQDDDTHHSIEERDAMKAVELADLKDGTCELTNALETGLQKDIEQKNYEFMGKESMGVFFDTKVLPAGAPTQNTDENNNETSAAYRVRTMKYLLKNALQGITLPDGIVANEINEKNPDLTTNDILALHYFQLLRHIPGKSKPDAICGPLTMKDLLAANDVDLTEKIKESKDSVFVKYKETPIMLTEGEKKQYTVPVDSIKMYKLGDTIISVNKEGIISEIDSAGSAGESNSEQKDNLPQGSKKVESSVNALQQFKEKYFGDAEVYEAFIKTIPTWINVYDIAQTKSVIELRHKINLVDITIKHTEKGLHVVYGGAELGDIDLGACIDVDQTTGFPKFNKDSLKSQILIHIDNYVNKLHTNVEVDRRINLGKEFIHNTHFTLADLFGTQAFRNLENNYMYEAFIKKYFPSGKITLHPTATKIADEGEYKDNQLRFTLGNFDYATGYKDKPFLYNKYVALDKVTTSYGANGYKSFDKEKWKPYLASIIKQAVEQYADISIKKNTTDIAAK